MQAALCLEGETALSLYPGKDIDLVADVQVEVDLAGQATGDQGVVEREVRAEVVVFALSCSSRLI